MLAPANGFRGKRFEDEDEDEDEDDGEGEDDDDDEDEDEDDWTGMWPALRTGCGGGAQRM